MELTRASETYVNWSAWNSVFLRCFCHCRLMRQALTTADPSARLRAAAEHGRLREVRSLLAAGTAITRDSVRKLLFHHH